MMFKSLISIAIILGSVTAFSQFIDGPANVRNSPNGELLFELSDYVDIYVNSGSNNWFEIESYGRVLPESLINKIILKSGSIIYNATGDTIGIAKTDFEIVNENERYYEYDGLERIRIKLEGWTYTSNIRQTITQDEHLKFKGGFSEECQNSIAILPSDFGFGTIYSNECDLYLKSFSVRGESVEVLVKEERKIKVVGGAEGQESIIDLHLKPLNDSKPRHISVEADKIRYVDDFIEAIKFGCCASPDEKKLYSYETLEKLIEFETELLRVEVPNSIVKGHSAFSMADYGKKYEVGKLTLLVNGRITSGITIESSETKTPEYKNFPPELRLVPLREKDVVKEDSLSMTLWSKNQLKNSNAISGFNIEIEFWDETDENKIIQIPIIDGYINGIRGDQVLQLHAK